MLVCVSHDELHPWVARGGDKLEGRDTVLRMGSLVQADCSLSPEKDARGPRMVPPGRKMEATGWRSKPHFVVQFGRKMNIGGASLGPP